MHEYTRTHRHTHYIAPLSSTSPHTHSAMAMGCVRVFFAVMLNWLFWGPRAWQLGIGLSEVGSEKTNTKRSRDQQKSKTHRRQIRWSQPMAPPKKKATRSLWLMIAGVSALCPPADWLFIPFSVLWASQCPSLQLPEPVWESKFGLSICRQRVLFPYTQVLHQIVEEKGNPRCKYAFHFSEDDSTLIHLTTFYGMPATCQALCWGLAIQGWRHGSCPDRAFNPGEEDAHGMKMHSMSPVLWQRSQGTLGSGRKKSSQFFLECLGKTSERW